MNELLRMNAQWQQAHQSLNAESESMRQRLGEVEQLPRGCTPSLESHRKHHKTWDFAKPRDCQGNWK